MRIGIPKEIAINETRVAATPLTVAQLIKMGFDVAIESGAGERAKFSDNTYESAGAQILNSMSIWHADIIFKINPPTDDEIKHLNAGTTLISFIWPSQNQNLIKQLADKEINVLAMDTVPRISRAQSLDALSSMANIAGYRAVIEAAHQFGRFFTGQITAAGKVSPAKIMVIGAGVAGLAAIGTANRLGAVVRAFDTRPEVKEQVESMGAECLELHYEEDADSADGYAKEMSAAFIKAEMDLFMAQAKEVDIIITTALIPGRPAPRLITQEMVNSMKPGSVIVDLAAQTGGNCELTQADDMVITDNHVKIIGYTDLPGRLPTQSSQLYASNLVNLMKLLSKEKNGQINIDFDDNVLRGMTVAKAGAVTWPAPPIPVSATSVSGTSAPLKEKNKIEIKKQRRGINCFIILMALILFAWLAQVSPPEFLSHFTVFTLACVVGYYVVWNVTHALHTPLMSVTNAISGIIIVGAILQINEGGLISILAFIAVLIASINIFGGFMVTQRMLKMFRKN